MLMNLCRFYLSYARSRDDDGRDPMGRRPMGWSPTPSWFLLREENQEKKYKSDAAAPITASSGEEPVSKQLNPLRNESTFLCLPLIEVGGIKDFKFNLQDGAAEYRSKNGTLDIERQPDGSRLCIDVFDGAHGQIAVYLPNGKLSGVYRRETLPRKYHPIYILGWKINEIVRATTPYLTVSDKPAGVICTLMSNHPFPNFDFRLCCKE